MSKQLVRVEIQTN